MVIAFSKSTVMLNEIWIQYVCPDFLFKFTVIVWVVWAIVLIVWVVYGFYIYYSDENDC